MYSLERNRVYEASSIQKRLESIIFLIFLNIFLLFDNIEVAFCMPEFICVVLEIERLIFEFTFKIKLWGFERAIVNDWQDIFVICCCVYYLLPEAFVAILSEQEIVNSVKEWWIIKCFSNLSKFLLKSLMQLRIADVPDPIAVHQMCKISIPNLFQVLQHTWLHVVVSFIFSTHFVILTMRKTT